MTSPKQADELLPCPFCGGPARVEREGTPRQSCIVYCGDCGATREGGEIGFGRDWNERARLSPSVPDGYVLVPKLPSAKHWEAVAFNLSNEFCPEVVEPLERFAKAFWREMLFQTAQPTSAPPEAGKVQYALQLILPMAKGYAAEHPVGSNAEYIRVAEEALRHPAPPTGLDGWISVKDWVPDNEIVHAYVPAGAACIPSGVTQYSRIVWQAKYSGGKWRASRPGGGGWNDMYGEPTYWHLPLAPPKPAQEER